MEKEALMLLRFKMQAIVSGDFLEAIDFCTDEIARHPECTLFIDARADFYERHASQAIRKGEVGEYNRLLECALIDRRALLTVENNAIARYNLGLTTYKLNRYPEAFRLFCEALALGMDEYTDSAQYMRNLTYRTAMQSRNRGDR